MVPSLTRSHVLILPLVILFVILLEEIAAYYLRLAVSDVYLRTAFIMMLYGPGIALFAAVVSPRLKSTLVSFRSRSRRSGGRLGIALFFSSAYAFMFYAYLLLETKGPTAFLPRHFQSSFFSP